MAKIALISGISGQDGSYLSELLLSKGYEVHGLVRRNSAHEVNNVEHLKNKITLHYGDLYAGFDLSCLIHNLQPNEIYNLAAQSDVGISFIEPEDTIKVNYLAVCKLLDAIRFFSPKSKLYQASTSEMFGNVPAPQDESTSMVPVSPYGVSKLAAYINCGIYRDSYKLFVSNGILFNHESPRRGPNFVTRKITMALADIIYHKRDKLELGNLDACRDWGYAGDYVEAMWLMLQQDKPDDFVIGTGETHSIKEFLEEAFSYCNLDWQDYVIINPAFYRPVDVRCLRANPAKAKKELNWTAKVTFKELVRMMVKAELTKTGVLLAKIK